MTDVNWCFFCYKLWDACFLSSDESIRDTCFDFETMFSNSFLLVWIARSKRGGWLKLLFVSKMPGAQLKLFVSIERTIILRASPPLHLARLVAAKKAHMVVASNLRCKVRCFFWSGMKLFVTFIAGRHLAWQWLMFSPERWYTCVEK